MFKVAGLVGILTIISKVLGLARDLVIANYFGTSMMADAFNMAYLFTGNFFILFGGIGGPFYSSVIAVLPKLDGHDPRAIKQFLKSIFLKSFMALTVVALIIYLSKSYILQFFIDPAKEEYFNMTLFHINILLPLIVICGPIGILFAILNVYKRYFAPSLSPAVINIILIGTVFVMGDSNNGLALSLGMSLGAVISMLFQVPGYIEVKKQLKEAGSKIHEKLEEIKEQLQIAKDKYGEILYPALLSTGLGQGIVYVDSFFCDGLGEGSWTSVVMANRLIQLPLGVLLTAFLVPLFPALSSLAKNNNYDEMRVQIKKALRVLVAICLPATFVGVVFAEPLIRLLFERGAFDANSTLMVSTVFFWLCFTIIPYLYRDTVTRVFYSLGDSRTPMFVGALAIALKIACNYYLVAKFGLAGIPMASIIVIIVNFVILSLLLKRKTGKYICLCV